MGGLKKGRVAGDGVRYDMLEQVMECCEMLKSHMTQQVCYAPHSVHPNNNRHSAVFHQISHASINSMLSHYAT